MEIKSLDCIFIVVVLNIFVDFMCSNLFIRIICRLYIFMNYFCILYDLNKKIVLIENQENFYYFSKVFRNIVEEE